LIILLANLTLSCTHASPIPPLSEKIVDPKAVGCECKDLDLTHFILIGDEKLSRILAKLNTCYQNSLIDAIEEVK
jgi:hypothetical protein